MVWSLKVVSTETHICNKTRCEGSKARLKRVPTHDLIWIHYPRIARSNYISFQFLITYKMLHSVSFQDGISGWMMNIHNGGVRGGMEPFPLSIWDSAPSPTFLSDRTIKWPKSAIKFGIFAHPARHTLPSQYTPPTKCLPLIPCMFGLFIPHYGEVLMLQLTKSTICWQLFPKLLPHETDT